jgi:hypothetical protein
MTRRSRIAALAAVLALAGAGCANNDAKESDVVGAMEDADLSDEQAECIGARMQDEFGDDQDLYNDVASASDVDELPGPGDEGVDEDKYPDGTEPVVRAILDECLAGESPESGDTTSTTAAGGAGATGTTAPGGAPPPAGG